MSPYRYPSFPALSASPPIPAPPPPYAASGPQPGTYHYTSFGQQLPTAQLALAFDAVAWC